MLHACVRTGSGGAVNTRLRPSGENAYSSPPSKVLAVGTASLSPGVTSRGSPAAPPSRTGSTKTCWRLSSTHESQWRKSSCVNTRAFTGFFSRAASFCALSLSDSAKGLAENSGNTAETNASCVPSGDHTGALASVESAVTLCGSPPSTGMSQIW